MADVEVVATFELYNISRTKLENLIHRILDPARLDIQIKDRFGNPVVPREWFLVLIFAVEEAVQKIQDGTIADHIYDVQKASLVRRALAVLSLGELGDGWSCLAGPVATLPGIADCPAIPTSEKLEETAALSARGISICLARPVQAGGRGPPSRRRPARTWTSGTSPRPWRIGWKATRGDGPIFARVRDVAAKGPAWA